MTAEQAKARIQDTLNLDQTTQAKILNMIESVEETALNNLIGKALYQFREQFPFESGEESDNRDRYYFLSGFLHSLNQKSVTIESKINKA